MKATTHVCRERECWVSHTDLCVKSSLPWDLGRMCSLPRYHSGQCDNTIRLSPKLSLRPRDFVPPAVVCFTLSFIVTWIWR